EVGEITRGMLRMLWNSYSFFVLYAEIDKFEADKNFNPQKLNGLLDKWLVSELHMLIGEFNLHMENYELHKASRLLPKFIDNLSNWYIRRSRKRFWKSENDGDKTQAYQTLYYVLVELSKVMAPFTPFVAEEIYRNLKNVENVQDVQNVEIKQSDTTNSTSKAMHQIQQLSVHLADFPVADESLIDEALNGAMLETRILISLGLQLRADSKNKVRQPLNELVIEGYKLKKELIDIVKEEINVKKITEKEFSPLRSNDEKWKGVSRSTDYHIYLDTEITPELKLEGQAREIVRYIQEMRKEAGYEVDNRIKVWYSGLVEVFDKFGELIAKETLADSLLIKDDQGGAVDLEKEFTVDGEKLIISIKK
ncbi:MAG: class I tRNA ligase family protein, partial [Candidatus Moraniibacteriota bacterium]